MFFNNICKYDSLFVIEFYMYVLESAGAPNRVVISIVASPHAGK